MHARGAWASTRTGALVGRSKTPTSRIARCGIVSVASAGSVLDLKSNSHSWFRRVSSPRSRASAGIPIDCFFELESGERRVLEPD